MSDQAALLSDVYQFYSFIQANTFDQLIRINDRFEYETLWRFPIADQLTQISGGQNSFFETGRFDIMNNLDAVRLDMVQEYRKYNPEMDKQELNYRFKREHMEHFLTYGTVTIGLNPYEIDCENCFNPSLKYINVKYLNSTDNLWSSEISFQITHLGTEVNFERSYNIYLIVLRRSHSLKME